MIGRERRIQIFYTFKSDIRHNGAMFWFVLTPLVLLSLAGLAAISVCLKRSVRGYEDDRGFHEGAEPIAIRARRNYRASTSDDAVGQATFSLF